MSVVVLCVFSSIGFSVFGRVAAFDYKPLSLVLVFRILFLWCL